MQKRSSKVKSGEFLRTLNRRGVSSGVESDDSMQVLMALQTGPVPADTLAERLSIPPTGLLRILKELEYSGLVGLVDKSGYKLTDSGRRLVDSRRLLL